MPRPRVSLASFLARLHVRHSGIFSLGKWKQPVLITSQIFLTAHVISSYIGTIAPTSGISMVPTIPHSYRGYPWCLESRLHRRGRNIKVGDIIVFTHPIHPNQIMSKRVIGMPGDYVSVMTPGRTEKDLGKDPDQGDWANVKEQMIRVPEGHCWVAGDNLDWSRDSRVFGPLPLGLVRGKVMAVLLPVRAWTWFGNKSQLNDAQGEEKEWVRG